MMSSLSQLMPAGWIGMLLLKKLAGNWYPESLACMADNVSLFDYYFCAGNWICKVFTKSSFFFCLFHL